MERLETATGEIMKNYEFVKSQRRSDGQARNRYGMITVIL